MRKPFGLPGPRVGRPPALLPGFVGFSERGLPVLLSDDFPLLPRLLPLEESLLFLPFIVSVKIAAKVIEVERLKVCPVAAISCLAIFIQPFKIVLQNGKICIFITQIAKYGFICVG